MKCLYMIALLATACSSAPTSVPPEVSTWGSMREVLREGRTEGRVELAAVLGPRTVAVGALAGLSAEITVDRGALHLAEALVGGKEARERPLKPGDDATLLVSAEVSAWSESVLAGPLDLTGLEARLQAESVARGWAPDGVFPFRVEGAAEHVELHVLNGSCPIADPSGPAPWRLSADDTDIVLIGFFAENRAGTITHHGHKSHTHVVVPDRSLSGHLDTVSLEAGARLFLPEYFVTTSEIEEGN
jgi:hypothetical protein